MADERMKERHLPIRLCDQWEKTNSFRLMSNGHYLRRETRLFTLVCGGKTLGTGLEHRWVPELRYIRETDNGWIISIDK